MNRSASETATRRRQASAGAGRRDIWEAFGDRIVARGHLNETKLARAVASAEKTGETLASVLVKLGLCSEDNVAATLADILGLDHLKPGSALRLPADLVDLRPRFLLDADIIPLTVEDGEVVLAMADPLDDEAAQAVAYKTGLVVRRVVASRSDIRAWLSAIRPAEQEIEAGQ